MLSLAYIFTFVLCFLNDIVEWITNSSGHKYNFVAPEKNYCEKFLLHTTNSAVWEKYVLFMTFFEITYIEL